MFLVVLHRSGPDYDASVPLEEQSGWPEHAAFMDGLVENGFIVLGGPLSDEHRVVHAVEAESPGRGARCARERSLERLTPAGRRDRAVDDQARRAPTADRPSALRRTAKRKRGGADPKPSGQASTSASPPQDEGWGKPSGLAATVANTAPDRRDPDGSFASQISSSSCARMTASSRLCTPRRPMMPRTWLRTVSVAMPSRSAIVCVE